jgi:hypothetical protein
MDVNKMTGFHFTEKQIKILSELGWSYDGNGIGNFGECYRKATIVQNNNRRCIVPYFIDIQQGCYYLYTQNENEIIDLGFSYKFNELLDDIKHI